MLGLVSAGVPWEIAEKLKPHQLLAYQVIIGEQKGGDFDWRNMRWRERK